MDEAVVTDYQGAAKGHKGRFETKGDGPKRTGEPGEHNKKWRYRYGANFSPAAFTCLLRAQIMLREIHVPWDVSASTTLEFLYAVMRAYQKNERLDISKWKPKTMKTRPRVPRKRTESQINQIAEAEERGLDYLKERLEKIERDIDTKESRSDRAKRIPRVKDQEQQG